MEDFLLDIGGLENAVYYEIHPPIGSSPAGEEQLLELHQRVMDTLLPYLEGYIWQRDVFTLQSSYKEPPPWGVEARSAAGKSTYCGHPCLWGKVCFGDNIEDEWFVVWLLQEATRRVPGATARVWDNDGEFILIEVSHHIPSWLRPDTAGNRVWLHEGLLHIVPRPSLRHPTLPGLPSLSEALAIVRADTVRTRASSKTQQALADRTARYPGQAQKNMIRARARVPSKVAHLLVREPQLVAPAVEAFHMRDKDDVRNASRLATFPPQDFVSVLVKMNRCQYAQLVQPAFEAPKAYPMPPGDAPDYRPATLGMRLTCAFQMMYDGRARFDGEPRAPALMDTAGPSPAEISARPNPGGLTEHQVERYPAWATYRAVLEARGFFEGEMRGSARYRELISMAIDRFIRSDSYSQMSEALSAPVQRVDELLREPIDSTALEQVGQGDEDEVDDEWMSGGAAELEAELKKRESELAAEEARRNRKKPTTFDPQNFADRMKAFVDNKSGMEGAEEPKFLSADGVDFDDEAFVRELQGILNLDLPERKAGAGGWFSDDDDVDLGGSTSEDDEDDGEEEEREGEEDERILPEGIASFEGAPGGDQGQYMRPGEIAAREGIKAPSATSRAARRARSSSAADAGAAPARWEDVACGNVPRDVRAFPPLEPLPSKPKAADWTVSNLRPSGPAASRQGRASGTGSAGPGAVSHADYWPEREPGASGGAAWQPGDTGNGPRGGPQAGSGAPGGGEWGAERVGAEQEWDTMTATDSDDEAGHDEEEGDGFQDGYAAALAAELRSTAMARTFERVQEPLEGGEQAADDMEEDELQPVDVDYNLVKSLLMSFSQQQGRPGPVSNLAGLLNLQLPLDDGEEA